MTATGNEPARPRLRMGLAKKLALAFVGLVSLVLPINGGVDMWLGYRQARAIAVEMQQQKARDAASRIDGFIADIEQQIGWTTTPRQWSESPAGAPMLRPFPPWRLPAPRGAVPRAVYPRACRRR